MHGIRSGRIRNTLAVATILAISGLTVVESNASAKATAESTSYSRSKLNQLVRDAHTPAQYQALAAYFSSQETIFQRKAAAEKVEWERRQAVATGPQYKYPTPADSARNLYEYYNDQAKEMAKRTADYEQRAQRLLNEEPIRP